MFKGASHAEVVISASAIPVAGADGKPLRRIRLLPAGEFILKDGRGPFTVDPAAVVAAARKYWGVEKMPLDYDHQTLATATKSGVGGTAPASAWIKPANITAEADGVWANDIEWTPAAAARIEGKEYLYFSPLYGSKSGAVTNVYGGGLTNDPAIGGLTVVAASRFHTQQEQDMDLAPLAAIYGLVGTSTLPEIMTAASAQASQLAELRTTIGVAADATHEALVAAASGLKTAKTAGEGEVIVPASAWADMQARVGGLQEDRIAASVQRGLTEGKITPATEPHMTAWAKRDLDGFNAYLKDAPLIAAATTLTNGGAPVNDKGLTEEERVAASSAGLAPEEFLAAKASDQKEA